MDAQTGEFLNDLALKINRIERMLKWLVARHTEPPSPYSDDEHMVLPDISDILEEK